MIAATFHSACPATAPGGTELLRAICIMSMAPRLLLSPTILRAGRLAYEAAQGTGGSVLARSGAAEEMLVAYEDDPDGFLAQRQARPQRRDFATSPPAIRRLVGENFDFSGAPPQSRIFTRGTETVRRNRNWNKEQQRQMLEMAARRERAVEEYARRVRERGEEGAARL